MSFFIGKRAISEMISYVMLIVIALSLSVLVYAYLKVYVPKDKVSCQEEMSLFIKEARCLSVGDKTNISLTLENKGLFKVDTYYVRMGKEGREVIPSINDPLKERGIDPSKSIIWMSSLKASDFPRGNYTLEVQPAIISKRKIVVCPLISRQSIQCH